jgi:hypothetical protein
MSPVRVVILIAGVVVKSQRQLVAVIQREQVRAQHILELLPQSQ